MSEDRENVIRERRTTLATKKNLMGPSGKLGMILKAFGTPIIRQGSGLIDISFLGDPFGDDVHTEYASTMSGQQGPVSYRDEILTYSGDGLVNEGLMFDGLSRGVHIEILYWHAESKLKVTFKGYTVYLEIAGELAAYNPFEEWEGAVDRLHASAQKRLKQIDLQESQEYAERSRARKNQFWQELRARWGI